jgi:hypothetical protein
MQSDELIFVEKHSLSSLIEVKLVRSEALPQ